MEKMIVLYCDLPLIKSDANHLGLTVPQSQTSELVFYTAVSSLLLSPTVPVLQYNGTVQREAGLLMLKQMYLLQ